MSPQHPVSELHHWLGTETIASRVGRFDFVGGYPTAQAVQQLGDLLTFNRAVEVVLQNVAAVSMFKFRQGLSDFGIKRSHQVAIWAELLDAHTLLLTPNADTVYTITFLDLRHDGPTVVELPAGMLGVFDDMWMRYIVDGGVAGPDRGEGGKYLLLPPGHAGDVPSGHFVHRSPTHGVWVLMRAVDPDPRAASARSRQMKIYPLAHADRPPPMTFADASGKFIDTIHSDDFTFFQHLHALIDEEPADAVGSLQRFYLASIGIVKGQPFEPTGARRALLAEAARVGAAMARMLCYGSRDPDASVYPDRRWQAAFVGGSHLFDSQGYENLDRRAAFAYAATGNTPAMASKVLGAGAQYIWTPRDAHGDVLEGHQSYRLRIPPQPPAKDFWSVTVYDAMSRSMLHNGQRFPTVSLYSKPRPNPDGSIDIFFGPEPAPAGQERNWIQTLPDRGWFAILRFYGPLQPFFDKTWRPDDIEPIAR
jgi:hypothetical protein